MYIDRYSGATGGADSPYDYESEKYMEQYYHQMTQLRTSPIFKLDPYCPIVS